jgi:predicted peptidase
MGTTPAKRRPGDLALLAAGTTLVAAGLVTAWHMPTPAVRLVSGGPDGGMSFTYTAPSGEQRAFFLFAPAGWERSGRQYPLTVFLHGAGEAGLTNRRHAREVGPGKFALDQPATFPLFVLAPQGRDANWMAGSEDSEAAFAILEQVMARYPIDPDRVSLTGHSAGGQGVWSWAEASPERWSALVPVAAWAPVGDLRGISSIPCWVFHGGKDPTASPADARAMVSKLKAMGAPVRYTEFPATEHVIWARVYRDRAVWAWIAEQTRTARGAATSVR